MNARLAQLRPTGTLLVSHLVGLAAAFVTVPYLARVLRPEHWGQVLLAQSLAAYLTLLVEYAFDLSVTRRVAALRPPDSKRAGGPSTVSHALSVLVADAVSARLLLGAGAVLLWLAVLFVFPALRLELPLALSALMLALGRGLSPLWFFLGMERVTAAVTLDTVGKVASAALVFLLVTEPAHAWRAVALPAASAWLVLFILARSLCTAAVMERLSLAGGVAILREGMMLVSARMTGAVYMQINTALVALVATPATVAIFGGAERIVRAGVSLLEPLTRALLARLSRLRAADVGAADRVVARLVLLLAAGGTLAALLSIGFAPLIVRLLLGSGYEAAVPVFRLLSLLIPIIAVGTGIGIFSAVPRRSDSVMLMATMGGGAANLLLAVPLTTRYGATGMAISVLTAETIVVVILLVWYLRKARIS